MADSLLNIKYMLAGTEDGKSKYDGEFKNGVFEGTGSYYFSGDTTPAYTGIFKDGKIQDDTVAVIEDAPDKEQ